MKLSKLWKTLSRDERRAWNAWAKSNKLLLDDGSVRRVSGHKAMTMVVRNRTLAGEAANPATLPAAVAWLDGALGVEDAGPYTENLGFIGFRATQNVAPGTKWFVWATPAVTEDVTELERLLRFVTVLNPGGVNAGDVIAINAPYLAVWGSWDGPGEDGAWPTPHYVWFRVHQYADGVLSPGRVMRGEIVVEL
jgi:hypothetical protein